MSSLFERTLARRGRWLIAALFLCGAAVTGWLALQTERIARDVARRQFDGHVERLEHEIIVRIERAEYGLRGLRSALLLKPGLDRGDFARIVGSRDLWQEFRGVRGFGFIERVPRAGVDEFVRQRRAEGPADFRIQALAGGPPADDLFVVRYIEPHATNAAALGLDLGSDPQRREAIGRALASGEPTLSGRLSLLQDARRGAGWVFMAPVFAQERGRERRLLGLLHAPLVAGEILGDLQSFVDFSLDFRLYDGPPEEGRPMLDTLAVVDPSAISLPDRAHEGRSLRAERQFVIGGRVLTLQAASRRGASPAWGGLSTRTLAVSGAGALLTLALALAAWLQVRDRGRALLLAQRITADLERTSADLARSNQRLQAVLDNLPCGLSVFDRDLKLVAQNAFLRKLLGLPQDEAVPPLELGALAPLLGLERGGAPGEPVPSGWRPFTEAHRFERVLPDGTVLEIHAGPMPDGGFVMTYVDHSARQRAERALQASENLMRLVADSIPGRIAYWDRQGICRFANAEFLNGRGMGSREVLGRHWRAIYGDCADDPLRPRRIADALAGLRQTFEKTDTDADGNRHTRMVHYIPDLTGEGEANGYFAIGLDVTELREARDDALRASQAKSRFVANMSHELRTPMNAVLGMLQLVQHTALTPQQQDYVFKAEGAAKALLSVLNDILDFSKVEAGKMSLDPREFDVDALLRDLSVIFATSVGARPVDLLIALDPRLPARLVADDMRLRQVLINLVGNAIKFTERGMVRLSLAPVAWEAGRVAVDLAIEDTGIGIAPDSLKRLFQDFGQAEAQTTRRFGGTGLGLAISRRLVALMGGELQVRSEPGRGSCFSFRLWMPVPAEAQPPQAPALRVLLADCRDLTRQAHAAMARGLGWDVTEAEDAGQALALARGSQAFDAVFVDWLMGREVALETARQLGEALDGRDTALVVLGNCEVQELLAQLEPARQNHIGACLSRPLTPGMLVLAVAQARSTVRQVAVAPAPQPTLALSGLRLLVAEDNENNQLVARELLTRQGAQVDIAPDGLEALRKVRECGPYDLVLMDWQMPHMDGLQATRAIRALGPAGALPIVAMTANAMESDRRECLAAGMDDHVAKPFVVGPLVQVLLAHVGRAGRPAPVAAEAEAEAPGAPQEEPLLDRAAAVEALGGLDDLYDELVPLFRAEAPQALARLDDALATGTREAAVRLAHTLKGTAGTLGARYLAQVCREAEAVMKAAPSDADAPAVAAVRAAVARTLSALG